VLIALSGSFEVVLNDGTEKSFLLNKPNIGLYIPTGIGANCIFPGAVCLVLALMYEEDYIRI
jgi:hypothetical protein